MREVTGVHAVRKKWPETGWDKQQGLYPTGTRMPVGVGPLPGSDGSQIWFQSVA